MSQFTFVAFHNALAALSEVTEDDLVRAGALRRGDLKGWEDFAANPARFVVKRDMGTAERVWRVVAPRINGRGRG